MFSRTRRWTGILLVFLFLVTAVAACSREQDDAEDSSADSSANSSAPTETLVPTDTPMPAATPAPTATAVPTIAPAHSAMSSDSYAEMFCDDTGSEEIENITYSQLSAEVTGSIEMLESMGPPQEYAGWHEAFLSFGIAQLKALEDHAGAEDDLVSEAFFFEVLMPLTFQLQSDLAAAVTAMDAEARARLAAAGCDVDAMASAPEDFGTIEGDIELEMQELIVGAPVAGTLEQEGESDLYYFRAEEGQTYLIEAQWEGLTSVNIELAEGLTFTRFIESSQPPLQLTWTAPASGEYELYFTAVSGSGSYTLSITIET